MTSTTTVQEDTIVSRSARRAGRFWEIDAAQGLQDPGWAQQAFAWQPEVLDEVLDGELVAGTALGWNFGDGHMCNEQLIAALQERCNFEPGEVRVVLIDAQPIQRQTQRYRLVDAATGEFESGYVRVADMANSQPWDDALPVYVDGHATQN